MNKNVADLEVIISNKETECNECGENLDSGAWVVRSKQYLRICLSCADIDHLEYLPSGDAALTRRSRKHSTLTAVVLKWSRNRKRYERQGLLVEKNALKKAEEECLKDSDARARRRERDKIRRNNLNIEYINNFASRLRALFPGCDKGVEFIIAEHACLKYSGRVGRSAAAKQLDEDAITLAVIAHIRHTETKYDELLADGFDRRDARREVKEDIENVLLRWRSADSQ